MYFGVLNSKKSIANPIQGMKRRKAIEAALDAGDPTSVPSLVIGEQLDEGTRQAFAPPSGNDGRRIPACAPGARN